MHREHILDWRKRSTMLTRHKSIYGVSWDGTANPVLTRTDRSVGLIANAGVDAGIVANNFDYIYPWSVMSETTDILGNVFIRIPRFYIKKTSVGVARTWQVSEGYFDGAYLPACFSNATYVDVGKYNSNLNGGGTKLESKYGTLPLVSKNIVDVRAYAKANGVNYYQMDVHVLDLIKTLFYVEFATLNSQSIMAGFVNGAWSAAHTATVNENAVNRVVVANAVAALFIVGQTVSLGTGLGWEDIFVNRIIQSIGVYDAGNKAISVDGAAFNVSIGQVIYSKGWKSGFSSSIVAKSGSLVSNATGGFPCVYRGIENPWGNVNQFIDGVNIDGGQAWVCRNPDDYDSSDFASPYEQLSYVNGNAEGYATIMGFDPACPYAEFPTAAIGDNSTYYSDYYYPAAGQRIAQFGGIWFTGGVGGLSCFNLSDTTASTGIYIGSRLIKAGE